ncbi:glycerophosphodiester phosphodiesterase family protein [Streptomyces sp. H10-C2]|uniref:glycerophosphodiester phosphodiesterase n=1 Tax=unclassified Streptomyces TaxID=2593676 RepID=UPI0024BB962E|nr:MULTISPECIES: glycerophosphodiester phosphodiesterase family protein [unclassified Streptomyces]MDJ0342931.1 glycerophosphodiester phosphodiesterase family protein [Streptomyces sp. PH10-H1]MDJ0372705.1 glycerophosphodiester phosphodiesterase family protein [Streptomyces sp. H10-C2]
MSFLTVGHRGVMGVEPENTLRSFARAEREGLDQIELDLHLSKDGALVVMHDAEVDRTTDGSGRIGDLTLDELRELDAGLGERVPVFEEVLDAVTRPVQAEIKDVAAARVLARVLRERAAVGRVSVLSFHDEALREIHQLLPESHRVLVADDPGRHLVSRARAVGARMVSLELPRISLGVVRQCRAAGIDVIAWTVNTPQELALARAFELDGIVTDLPSIDGRTMPELAGRA